MRLPDDRSTVRDRWQRQHRTISTAGLGEGDWPGEVCCWRWPRWTCATSWRENGEKLAAAAGAATADSWWENKVKDAMADVTLAKMNHVAQPLYCVVLREGKG